MNPKHYILHWEFDELQPRRGWRGKVNDLFHKLHLKMPYPPVSEHEIRRIQLLLTGTQIDRLTEPPKWLGDLITQIISYGRVRKLTGMQLFQTGPVITQPPEQAKNLDNDSKADKTPPEAIESPGGIKNGHKQEI